MRRDFDVPQIKTIIQSFDAARYHDDDWVDTLIDTSHARTEALMALLFGRTIVVPAGQIADCPAFIAIFCEVMNAQREVEARNTLHQSSTYRPFILGLEEGYKNYDDFARSFTTTVAPLIMIDESAREQSRQRNELVEAMRRAYLNRSFDDLSFINPGYPHYMRLIADEFGAGSTSGVQSAYANRRRIYTHLPDGLGNAMSQLLTKLHETHGDTDNWQHLRAGLEAVVADFAAAGDSETDNPRLRGAWYDKKHRFGEIWDTARLWLDHALFREFTVRYDIQIPSYFLQEVDQKSRDVELSLAFAGDLVIESLKDRQRHGGMAMSASMDQVDWKSIWQMVVDPRFQASIKRMNGELGAALNEEWALLRAVQSEFADDPVALAQRSNLVRQTRESKVTEALDRHIQSILSELKDYVITNRAGRMFVSLKRSARKVRESKFFSLFSSSAKAAADDGGKAAFQHFLESPSGAEAGVSALAGVEPGIPLISGAAATGAVIAGPTGAAASGAAMAMIKGVASYSVGQIMRPTEIFGHSPTALKAAQAERVNYWLAAAHYN